ncbi:MAG: cyclic nucleotide-binding domain-containing protein [Candidatus Muiribacteriota bacterium]
MEEMQRFTKEVEAQTVLFSEGESSYETYLLLSGEVQIIASDKVVANISEKGTFIGEMGTLLKKPRSATVKTTVNSKFIVISPIDFEKIISQQPSIAFKLAKVLAERLQATTCELSKYKGANESVSALSADSDCQNEEEVDVKELVKSANAFYKEKNIDKAIENMEKAVEKMPENVKFRNNLAVFYFKNNQKDKAIKQWEEVIKLDPQNSKASLNLSKLKA